MSTRLAPRSMIRNLETIRSQFNQFLTDLTDGERTMLPIDINETEDAIIVRASVPGIKPKDLAVTINHGMLSIRGESREEREEQKGTWHVRERRAGSRYRSLTLPMAVNEDKAEATLKDGVLEIKLSKTEQSAGHRIKVQTTEPD